MYVSRGPNGAIWEHLFWRLRMKPNNMREALTYLLRESHWSSGGEVGVPFSYIRMGVAIRHGWEKE